MSLLTTCNFWLQENRYKHYPKMQDMNYGFERLPQANWASWQRTIDGFRHPCLRVSACVFVRGVTSFFEFKITNLERWKKAQLDDLEKQLKRTINLWMGWNTNTISRVWSTDLMYLAVAGSTLSDQISECLRYFYQMSQWCNKDSKCATLASWCDWDYDIPRNWDCWWIEFCTSHHLAGGIAV